MSEYWWGVVSPFIFLVALALLLGLIYLIFTAAHWLWIKVHETMIQKVQLKPNLAEIFEGDERPEYIDSANLFRDALMESPRLCSFVGLGWRIMIVREYKDV